MTTVKLFVHSGVKIHTNPGMSTGLCLLKQPSLGWVAFQVGKDPEASPLVLNFAGDHAAILRVVTEPGKRLAYRITNCLHGNDPEPATPDCDVIEGEATLDWGNGYRISFLDVTATATKGKAA